MAHARDHALRDVGKAFRIHRVSFLIFLTATVVAEVLVAAGGFSQSGRDAISVGVFGVILMWLPGNLLLDDRRILAAVQGHSPRPYMSTSTMRRVGLQRQVTLTHGADVKTGLTGNTPTGPLEDEGPIVVLVFGPVPIGTLFRRRTTMVIVVDPMTGETGRLVLKGSGAGDS
jgi:hypothetical protein